MSFLHHYVVDLDVNQLLLLDRERSVWTEVATKLFFHHHFESFVVSLGFCEELLVVFLMREDTVVLQALLSEFLEDVTIPVFVADSVRVATAAAERGVSSRFSMVLFVIGPVTMRLSIEYVNHQQVLLIIFSQIEIRCSSKAVQCRFVRSIPLLGRRVDLVKEEQTLVHCTRKASFLRELIKQLSFIWHRRV